VLELNVDRGRCQGARECVQIAPASVRIDATMTAVPIAPAGDPESKRCARVPTTPFVSSGTAPRSAPSRPTGAGMAEAADHHVVGAAPAQGSFHPIDSADSRCPHAKLQDLRASTPISIAEREGFPTVTVVTKYDDVANSFRNWRAFGNISSDPDPTRHDATPEDERVIIGLDPPAHTWVRRLSQLAMAPAGRVR